MTDRFTDVRTGRRRRTDKIICIETFVSKKHSTYQMSMYFGSPCIISTYSTGCSWKIMFFPDPNHYNSIPSPHTAATISAKFSMHCEGTVTPIRWWPFFILTTKCSPVLEERGINISKFLKKKPQFICWTSFMLEHPVSVFLFFFNL